MKVRPGFAASSTAHAALLAWGLINMSSAKPFDVGPTEALPIEIMSPQEFDAMTKGSKTSKKVDAPTQKAEKIAQADPAPPTDDSLPIQKENVDAPPPPSAPPKAETPPPPKPDPKAEAEKAAKADAADKAEKAEKAAKADAAKAEAARADAAKAEAAKADAAKAEAQKVVEEKAEKLAQDKAEKVAQDKAAKAEADKLAKAEADKAAKAEADKAAKEKADADKLAKAEKAAKDAKEKADAEKAAKAAERKFDPSKIAAMLDRKSDDKGRESQLVDKRSPGRTEVAARETAPETTAGTERGTAAKLSLSQRTGIDNAVREQVMQCWNPPVGAASDGSLAVRVQFTLNADGSLAGGVQVTNSSSNPAFRAAAGAATRAVQRCAPLKLPAESYDYWRQVNINFDPKDMMGG